MTGAGSGTGERIRIANLIKNARSINVWQRLEGARGERKDG